MRLNITFLKKIKDWIWADMEEDTHIDTSTLDPEAGRLLKVLGQPEI